MPDKNGFCTWTIFSKTNSTIQSNNFSSCGSSIFETADNEIVAASIDSGLQIFDDHTWQPLNPPLSTNTEKQIRCCARDSSGAIWIGTNAGILRLFNNQWYFYSVNDYYTYHAPTYNSYDVTVDKKNRVWFSMLHDGVYVLDQSVTPSSCSNFKKLEITSPVQSRKFTAGVVDSITWNTYGNIDSISILYKTALDGEWIDMFSLKRESAAGSRRWVVPSVTSNDYYMRIRDWEDSTVEDIVGPFSIVAQGTNLPPSISSLPDSIIVKANEPTTLTIRTADPEGDTVKFTYTNLTEWVSVKDSILTLNPVESSTGFTFTVTVSDGKGGSTIDSVKVIVDRLSENVAQSAGVKLQPVTITKTAALLTITVGNDATIHSGALYTLSGKKAGTFLQHGRKFTLERNDVSLNNSIFIVKVSLSDLHGSKRTVSKRLLWQ